MKRVLITGANSYVGTNVEHWLNREPEKYHVDTIDMIDDSWRKRDFSGYEVVFHVAGIAHVKETRNNRDLFFKVNRDLVIEVAKVSKKAGVSQFIFLSSMSVYGMDTGVINKETVPKPKNSYGKSKLQAEQEIKMLESDNFKIAILRPPMIYGKGCKGNYSRLAGLAFRTPIFPKVDNKRSMIYIDNLSELIKQLINNYSGGLFLPQNAVYVNTSELVRLIAEARGRKIMMTKLFNPLLRLLNISTVNKVFGDLIYDLKISEYEGNYRDCEFRESILKTEEARK